VFFFCEAPHCQTAATGSSGNVRRAGRRGIQEPRCYRQFSAFSPHLGTRLSRNAAEGQGRRLASGALTQSPIAEWAAPAGFPGPIPQTIRRRPLWYAGEARGKMFLSTCWFLVGALGGAAIVGVLWGALTSWQLHPQRSARDAAMYDACLVQKNGDTVACDAKGLIRRP
jgi:hypothetical protein